jgi:hypothetical protein
MFNTLKAFILIALGGMFTVSSTSAADLSAYRWKNRLLLLFAANQTDPDFKAFNRDLSRRTGEVKDRDMIVFRVLEEGLSQRGREALQKEDAEELQRRFRVEPGQFTVILVGKDGGVKMVRVHNAELQEFFDLIDSMPMRRREMRERGETQ